jgi:tyrosyl-tRNA synthetase
VKLGIDPTAPDIHLGHAVVLRKLAEFQRAGPKVVLIIGDYTARVGDPSGRSELRPMLSPEQIETNAATFQEQALKILDADPQSLEVRRNGEWLDMPMADLLALVRTTTAARLLERDDFAKRFSAHEPISLLELLYPLLQAYDSVAIDADVELGGTDQKFNLLLGRDIQRAYGKPEQAILTMPLLVGVEGQRKMSKSLGNQIGVTDAPEEIYGKTMSIPDEAIGEYRRLLLDDRDDTHERSPAGSPETGVEPAPATDGEPAPGTRGELARGTGGEPARGTGVEPAPAVGGEAAPGVGVEPAPRGSSARDAKRALARGLVGWLHSEQAAQAAERHFERLFVERAAPEEIAEASFARDGGAVHLPGLMAAEFGMSSSQARRLIDEGGVTLGDAALGRGEYDVPSDRADGQVLKVGKRRFRRLRAA